VALGLALLVAAVLRWTVLGAQMRAVADDPLAAKLWGINVNRVTAASWMVGSAIAAVAGVLITPLINFDNYSLTIVVIYAFAAALIGRLSSLPGAVLGAVLLGLATEYARLFSSKSGTGQLATFLVLLGALLLVFRPGAQKIRLA
jgi:branched-chain amino acid transport system permease protein